MWDTAKTKPSGSPISPIRTGPGENLGENPSATVGHSILVSTVATQPHQQQQQPAGQTAAKVPEVEAIAVNNRGERVEDRGPEAPSKYKDLVESSAAEEGASGGCSGGRDDSSWVANRCVSPIVTGSIYPKLVDREGAPGGCSPGGVEGSNRNGAGRPEGIGKGNGEVVGAKDGTEEAEHPTAAPKLGEDVDSSLATAAECVLSLDRDGKISSTRAPGLKNSTRNLL